MQAAPVSPEISAEGSVTFRLRAPKATEVIVRGQFGADTPLAKDADGVWTASLPKVKAGVWEYHFRVDGMSTIDPLNPQIKPQRNPSTSILHVPSSPPALWDLVEKTFAVESAPASRAFAGLSMGGRHAIAVALNHSKLFSHIGAFSSAPPSLEEIQAGLADAASTNSQLKRFWIACGKADFLFQQNEAFHKLLVDKGIKHEYEVTEGDHSWPIWREYLGKFVPTLFQ